MENKTNVPGSEVLAEHELPIQLKQLWDKAGNAMNAKNYDYVISLLQAVLVKEPRFLDGRRRLRDAAIRKKEAENKRFSIGGSGGMAAMKIQPLVKKDPLNAIAQLEKEVLAADPYSAQGNQLLFEACSAAAMPVTAGFAVETLVRGNPDNTKYMNQLGDYYIANGFYDKAANIFDQIVRLDPSDLNATQKAKNASARSSMAKSNFEGSFRDNLRDTGQAKELEAKSRTGKTKEQIQQQIDLYQAQYAEDNNNLNTVKILAGLYEEFEDFESALAYYEWAFQLSNGDVSLERKVVEIREVQRARKIREFEKWLEANPDHPDYEKVQADFEAYRNEHFTANIEAYKDQVERNPTDNALRFKYGEALFEAGQLKEAIPQLQRAQQSPNLRIKAMLMLGKCYAGRNMNDLAVDQFTKAAAELTVMDDTKKSVLYNLGLVHEAMGDKAGHLEAMKQIYAADYNYLDVAHRVESAYD